MSRFGDTLRKALQTTPASLGFRPTAPAKPRMVLVALLDELTDDAPARIDGADAVILGTNIKTKELKGLAKTMPLPWGVWLDGGAQGVKQADTAGADFVIFEPEATGLELAANERLGKVIAIDSSLETALLAGVGELPVEAIYMGREVRNSVSWLDLIQIRRIATIVPKPLLLPVAPDMPPAHFKLLWEAGVDAVVLPALAAGEIADIRRKMDELVLPARRKWLRARPLVPVVSSAPSAAPPAETPGEEEEEE